MARTSTNLPFVDLKNGPDAMRDLWRAITALLRGQSNNCGDVTLTANATTTTVVEPITTQDSHIALTPLTANASVAEKAGVWVSARTHGVGFTLTHASAAATDQTFTYAVHG